MEIADESQLKMKIMLYFLCLSKPLAHLRELPTHEAEYDMIDKAGAEKEREERERALGREPKDASPVKSIPKNFGLKRKSQMDNSESAQKLPSIAPVERLSTKSVSQKKILAKGNKEWWEKYNFSNTILVRYRFENKYEFSSNVASNMGQHYYVGRSD